MTTKIFSSILTGVIALATFIGVANPVSAAPIVNPNIINQITGTAYTAVMSADDSRLYAVDNISTPSRLLRIVDTATDTVVSTLDIPSTGGGGLTPYGIVISPDNKTLYLAISASPSVVYVIDISNENSPNIVTSIPVAGGTGIAMSPDGSKLVVTNAMGSTFSVIDTTSRSVTWTSPDAIASSISGANLRNPYSVAFSRDGTFYVVGYYSTTNGAGASGIVVVSAADNSILTTKTFSTSTTDDENHVERVEFSRDGNALYVGTSAGYSWWLRKYDITGTVNNWFTSPIWEQNQTTHPGIANLISIGESADEDTVYFTAFKALRSVNSTDGSTISTKTFSANQTDIRGLALPSNPSARFIYVANAYLSSTPAGFIYRFGELDITPKSQRVTGSSGSSISTLELSSTLSGSVTYSSTSLPAGVALNSSTGQHTGNLGAISAETVITITASNGVATQTATVTFKDNVPATLSPSTQTLTATVGTSFTSPTIIQAGFSSPPTFSVSPALPAGLTIDSSTGVISGTPTATSSRSTFTIYANGLDSATASVSLEVVEGGGGNGGSGDGAEPLARTGSSELIGNAVGFAAAMVLIVGVAIRAMNRRKRLG